MDQTLTWNDAYEIARLLSRRKAQVDLHEVSLNDILEWTKELPEFSDDEQIATDQILMAIFCEWLEEDFSK
jgi:FeS assembly protein IscX